MQEVGLGVLAVNFFNDGRRVCAADGERPPQQIFPLGRQLDAALAGDGGNGCCELIEVGVRPSPQFGRHSIYKVGERLFFGVAAATAKSLPLVRRQIDGEAQGAFDRHLPIPKGRVGEELGLLGLLKGEKGLADAGDV